jgi:hypothetical protein
MFPAVMFAFPVARVRSGLGTERDFCVLMAARQQAWRFPGGTGSCAFLRLHGMQMRTRTCQPRQPAPDLLAERWQQLASLPHPARPRRPGRPPPARGGSPRSRCPRSVRLDPRLGQGPRHASLMHPKQAPAARYERGHLPWTLSSWWVSRNRVTRTGVTAEHDDRGSALPSGAQALVLRRASVHPFGPVVQQVAGSADHRGRWRPWFG